MSAGLVQSHSRHAQRLYGCCGGLEERSSNWKPDLHEADHFIDYEGSRPDSVKKVQLGSSHRLLTVAVFESGHSLFASQEKYISTCQQYDRINLHGQQILIKTKSGR